MSRLSILWALVGALLTPTYLPAQDDESWRDKIPWLRSKEQRQPIYPELLLTAATVAERLAAGAVAIDTRAPATYAAGHLPGAIQIEITPDCVLSGEECLRRQLGYQGLSGQERLLLYGEPEGVGRLFWWLEWAGAEQVEILAGGVEAWTAAGHELMSDTAESRARATFEPSGEREVTVGAGWVAEGFGVTGTEVVDLRGAEAWETSGDTAARTPGHVPHSLPFDIHRLFSESFLDEEKTWPEPAKARRVLGKLGPRPGTYVNLDSTFVLYGDGSEDPRLGLAYLIFRLMDVWVRVYPGGWRDWSSVHERPVVRIVDAEAVRDLLDRSNPGLEHDQGTEWMPLVDTRGYQDFLAGHLPGAVSLPSHLCAERLPEALPVPLGIEAVDLPILFYCYGRDCIRSRHCSTLSARAGFGNLLWFRNGVPAWQELGLPLFVSEDAPKFPPRPDLDG